VVDQRTRAGRHHDRSETTAHEVLGQLEQHPLRAAEHVRVRIEQDHHGRITTAPVMLLGLGGDGGLLGCA
jgi:hypothetical protein